MSRKYTLWYIVAFVAILVLSFFGVAYANPSQFVNTTQTATATTSPAYMNPGTATSTIVYDTYQQSTGNTFTTDTVELLLQFTATSSSSTLNVNFEYANGYQNGNAIDCATNQTGCDWYQDTILNVSSGYATTTSPLTLSLVPQYQWKFASSTIGQQPATTTNNRDMRALGIRIPTRYVRAVFTCAVAVNNTGCGVWAQFVPTKEVR